MEHKKRTNFELLSIYSKLNTEYKNMIFFSLLKNEQRGICKRNNLEIDLFEMIESLTLKHINSIKEKMELLLSKYYEFTKKDICNDNYINIITDEIKHISSSIKAESIRGIALALFLDKNNVLPLIWYAFDKSYFNNYITAFDLGCIIQLSVSYLYRLIKVDVDVSSLGQNINAGAYCKIIKRNNKIFKIPLNYAALYYANMNEWINYKQTSNTVLSKYIPRYYKFNYDSGIIEKEYINGISGEEILLKHRFLSHIEKLKLSEIYTAIFEVSTKSKILFDIHPNNFVWNKQKKQWYLVDLGECQYIGSDYYIMNDFEKYYIKSWLEREMRKKEYPIRSVLLYVKDNN